MKVFFDTNVVLEYLLNRKCADDVERILYFLCEQEAAKYISCGSFYTLTYLLEIEFKKRGENIAENRIERLRQYLNILLSEYEIIGRLDWEAAVNDQRFSDIEDSYQYQAALSADCDVLLTLNVRDFKYISSDKEISILTPAEFLDKYCR